MSEMTAKEIKERMLSTDEEIFQKGNLDAVDELYSPDVIRHRPDVPQPLQGPEAWKEHLRQIQAAFPDSEFRTKDMIVDGNGTAQRWVLKGTHLGEFNGIPPTGKEVTVTGMTFSRIEDGKVVEVWDEVNILGLLQQLGVGPGDERDKRRNPVIKQKH